MNNTVTLNNSLKYEFITTYVLNKARASDSILDGSSVTMHAIRAWEKI